MKHNKKVVGYVSGVFDLFHVGHLNLLERAKRYCDYLIVGVVADDVCFSYKNRYPIICTEERRRIIESIKYTDEAVVEETVEIMNDKMWSYNKYKFDITFVGDDWKGTEKWNRYEKEFAEIGVRIMYLPYTQNISTTKIKEQIRDLYNIF